MKTDLSSQLAQIRHGDHLCMIYHDAEEQMAAAVPFIRDALGRGDMCLYVADDLTVEKVAASLAEGGVDVTREQAAGALVLATKRDAYLKDGGFDPRAMTAFLKATVESALARGFTGFSVTGEMTWALGLETCCDRLIEYEALLNEFFPGSKATALCQYNRRRFPAAVIRDVLRTHPLAIVGSEVCPNHYYEPPSLVLAGGDEEERVDWMMAQLKSAHGREARLESLNGSLERQKQILEDLAMHQPLDRILASISAFLCAGAGAGDCLFHLVERDGRSLRAAGPKPPPWGGAPVPLAPPYRHPAALAAHTARPVHSADPGADSRFAEDWRAWAGGAGLSGYRSVPVIAPDGEILGTLDYWTTLPGGRAPEAVETAIHLAGIAFRQLRADEALHASEEQLRQSHKMDAIGRLAGGVAHDFNNMLTAINGYSEILYAALGEGTAEREHVDEIRKAGRKAASLTHQLLAFGRQQRLVPAVLDLNEGVSGMVRMLERILGENIEIRTDFDPALGRIQADPTQISQVVLNLAVNAKEAMPDGGALDIETRDVDIGSGGVPEAPALAPGRYVRLTVRDTGTGMSRETMSKIFEPFFTTKDKARNSGLGLAMVYGVVSQSGGTLAVASEPGRGSVFRIWFPRVEAREEARDVPLAEPAREGRDGGRTVLVAEDEDMVRRLVVGLLQSAGYRVLQASRGKEALEMAGSYPGPIHLLLTDIIMPGMNGRELAAALASARPETEVLYMSGYAGETVLRHGVDAATAFIGKPFSPSALLAKLRELLGAPEPQARPRSA